MEISAAALSHDSKDITPVAKSDMNELRTFSSAQPFQQSIPGEGKGEGLDDEVAEFAVSPGGIRPASHFDP